MRQFSLVIAVLGLALLASAQLADRDCVIYNHTPSAPVGFYLRVADRPHLGAFVTVNAAAVAPQQARLRHYTDPRDRFIKRVAAVGGDQVCARDGSIFINGAIAAVRLDQRRVDLPLPEWHGCIRLAADQFFLLGDTPQSFDSRYWGPVNSSTVEGVWRPII